MLNPARIAFLLLSCATVFPAPLDATPQSGIERLDNLFGGPFALTATDHTRITDVSLRGKFLLIMFGYTNCPDICPLGLTTVSAALEGLADKAREVQPIFITVDPARDTPERLAEYAKSFDPRLLLLTGSESEIVAVTNAYRVHRQKYMLDDAGSTPGRYGVDHGSLMYLMGPDGKFRTIFPHGTTPEQLTGALQRYLTTPNGER